MDAPKLELRDLWKSFGTRQVLRGIDLAVGRGESLVLLGASGSGKSVLLKHLIGLLKPDRGSVLVDGRDLARAPKEAWLEFRRRCGMALFWQLLAAARQHCRLPPQCSCWLPRQPTALQGAYAAAAGQLGG